MTELVKCANELCRRLVEKTVLYCCHACHMADMKHYEIHEDGPLGHSANCNKRHAEAEGDNV